LSHNPDIEQPISGTPPDISDMGSKTNNRNVIDRWKIIHAKAPENGQYIACIEGQVASSNPRYPQPSSIRTSYLTAYEIEGGTFVVITARRSEYALGTRHPSEFLTEDFLKSVLPERKRAAAPSPFDGAGTQITAYMEPDSQEAPTQAGAGDNPAAKPRTP
jgi:hypothetical protein